MLGVLITLLFSVGAACFGHLLIRRLTPLLDPALRVGVSGLVGLGSIGTLTLFIGLAPGGLSSAGTWIVALVALASLGLAVRSKDYRIPLALPKGPELLLPMGLVVAALFALISVLARSDIMDWDSLAYHLAVPKLWLQAGQIQPITFIHHSNFPGAVDNLFIWGLSWGGESGAKAFTLAYHLFGIFAVFGFARQMYGQMAAWWSSLAWATIPAVLWLSGTAYVDVQNGLYAGLGILFAGSLFVIPRNEGSRSEPADEASGEIFRKPGATTNAAWLAGIMLGFAASSKYTGLQTIFAVCLVLTLGIWVTSRRPASKDLTGSAGIVPAGFAKLTFGRVGLIGGLALLIASPWYVKNVLWTGNPVYPFFYNQLGGKNWSPYQARIYQDEQQTFGAARPPQSVENPNYTAGKVEPQRIGHAILGLAYQPGRYINPNQTLGGGFPIGAVGVPIVAALLAWLISGRSSRFEAAVIATILFSFAMWFVLSEQSRYIIALGVPLSVLLGGAIVRLRVGPILAGLTILQALASFYLLKTFRIDTQLQVVAGKISVDDYRKETIPFFEPAQHLNEIAKGGRVALYDEVFGFLLDVPYLWANPGHSSELGYDNMQTSADLVASLKAHGITHVYLNLTIYPQSDSFYQRWIASMGLAGPVQPYSQKQRGLLMADLGTRWKVLMAEAVAAGQLRVERAFGRRLVLTFGA